MGLVREPALNLFCTLCLLGRCLHVKVATLSGRLLAVKAAAELREEEVVGNHFFQMEPFLMNNCSSDYHKPLVNT
jgi:hypothetical protein